jgi:bifunctional UDP-N-acetylglucosamine pyrophosphorylase/glucosamine-1-phosphate N-acetyltransferase
MRLQSPENSAYGRVLLQNNKPIKIIEAEKASPAQKQISLSNAGVYGINMEVLRKLIFNLPEHTVTKTINGQRQEFTEIFLTDIIEMADKNGCLINYYVVRESEAYGINTLEDLQNLPFRNDFLKRAMLQNVTFQDAQTCIPSFDTEISDGCVIGAFNVFGRGVKLESEVTILPFCFLENCVIGRGSTVGPFARIKGESYIGANTNIGNFVEIKHSQVNDRTKIKHLAYVGDAVIGKDVNVGAGTVFCNYDGIKKHQSTVEDCAKIGANTSLVAPITIGANAYIAAGSVITKDVPKETLAVARAQQSHNYEWVRKFFHS